MAGTITALKAQERSKDRVNVYLDGQFAFGLALIHALWLRVGQRVSDEDIATLKDADTLEKVKQRALRLISYRPRSVKEVQRRLQRAGVDEGTIGDVVANLQQAGLLDDESFTKSWVESRLESSPRSKRMIAWELRKKGVSESTIDASLGEVSDEAAAYRLAQMRWPRVAKLHPALERKRKLTEYLARHGFGFDVIQDVITKLEQEAGAQNDTGEDTAGDEDEQWETPQE
jgi:regulatory protein